MDHSVRGLYVALFDSDNNLIETKTLTVRLESRRLSLREEEICPRLQPTKQQSQLLSISLKIIVLASIYF